MTNALGAFTYAYVDQTSRLSGVTYPSGTGLSTSYAYFNNVGDQRLQTIQNMQGTTQLSRFDYTYNPVGTIATWTQQADSSTAVVNTLSYDNADQLTSAVQSGGGSASNAYHYDPAGNRLAEVTGSGTTAGQFNNLNQLKNLSTSTTSQTVAGHTSAAISSASVDAVAATITSGTNFSANVPLPPGTNVVSVVAQPTSGASATTQRYQIVLGGTPGTTLTYDANGNTLTDENGNSYQWDALNRLTKITYPGGASSLFAYDGLSRRTQIVEKNSSGTVTSTKNYLWIGQEMAEERNTSNTVTKRFFPQGEQQSGTDYYYTSDHLGSVREVCNSSGTIVARYSYDPYGRVTLVSGSNLATKQYTGDYCHATSGLNLTKYRAYDSNTGKWLSRDPKGENGGMNLYAYCHDKPIGLLDRLGLAAGTFDINFNPPTGGPANEPTPNGFNQPVQITYHKDPKECCKNIKLVQWARTNYETTPSYDTGGAPVNLSSPYNVAHTVPYPYQSSTADGATMDDEPGPDDFGSELSAAIVGYKEDFKVCSVCFDSYPFKVLGCRSWGVSMVFFGFKHHYGGGANLPAEP